MKATSIVLDAPHKINLATKLVNALPLEKELYEVTIKKYRKDRSGAQNRLQHHWNNEIDRQKHDVTKPSEEIGGFTLNEIRAHNKVYYGVPIMLEDPDFHYAWYAATSHLTQEQILQVVVGLDVPVTRLMNVEQKTRFLSAMKQHWESLGAELSTSDDFYYEAMGLKKWRAK